MRGSRDPRYHRYWPVRYHYPRISRAFYVSLCVGHREFIGDGPTRQAARHNAAQKALRILRNIPSPPNETENSMESKPVEVQEVSSGEIILKNPDRGRGQRN